MVGYWTNISSVQFSISDSIKSLSLSMYATTYARTFLILGIQIRQAGPLYHIRSDTNIIGLKNMHTVSIMPPWYMNGIPVQYKIQNTIDVFVCSYARTNRWYCQWYRVRQERLDIHRPEPKSHIYITFVYHFIYFCSFFKEKVTRFHFILTLTS